MKLLPKFLITLCVCVCVRLKYYKDTWKNCNEEDINSYTKVTEFFSPITFKKLNTILETMKNRRYIGCD
jgi:hypothetical protein